MTDAKTSKRPTQAAVRRMVKAWQKRLLLTHWRIDILFEPDPDEESTASCLAMPEYGQATLRFDLAKIPAEEIEAHVVHELCHAPIWPLSNFAHSMCGDDPVKLEALRNYEEGLATWNERAFLHVWGEGAG